MCIQSQQISSIGAMWPDIPLNDLPYKEALGDTQTAQFSIANQDYDSNW